MFNFLKPTHTQPKQQKIEYKTLHIQSNQLTEHNLNMYGYEGWEIINIGDEYIQDEWGNKTHTGFFIIFKRTQ